MTEAQNTRAYVFFILTHTIIAQIMFIGSQVQDFKKLFTMNIKSFYKFSFNQFDIFQHFSIFQSQITVPINFKNLKAGTVLVVLCYSYVILKYQIVKIHNVI